MLKRQLGWVADDDEGNDAAHGSRTFWGADADGHRREPYMRLATDPEQSLEQLADYCDERAARRYRRDPVGAHGRWPHRCVATSAGHAPPAFCARSWRMADWMGWTA